MCPHCLAVALGAAVLSVPLIKPTIGFVKSKFSRQEAMKENFSVLYGKKDDNAAR